MRPHKTLFLSAEYITLQENRSLELKNLGLVTNVLCRVTPGTQISSFLWHKYLHISQLLVYSGQSCVQGDGQQISTSGDLSQVREELTWLLALGLSAATDNPASEF